MLPERFYSCRFKRRYFHTLRFFLGSIVLKPNIYGDINHNIEVLCEAIHFNHRNIIYKSGHYIIIFPAITFLKMFDNAHIDILQRGIWEITFKIYKVNHYEIINYKKE